jgi:hypothetical protein
MDMERTNKKTTILFSPSLHALLEKLAEERQTSIGELVRTACERQYRTTGPTVEEKLAALRRISALKLPVSDVATMKRESVPRS